MAKNRPCFLQYDIPSVPVVDQLGNPRWRFNAVGVAVPMMRPVIDNPSDALWSAGCVRITYSCWLMMEANERRVYPIMNEMEEAGVRWYCVPFDASAKATLRAMALDNIQREIRERLISAQETRDEANAQLDGEDDLDYVQRRARYLRMARSIEKRVNEMISRVAHAAAEFDITSDQLRTLEVVGEVELIAGTMRERAQSFAQAHGIATRSTNATVNQAARDLRAGRMHPSIFADLIEEEEQTTEAAETANRLRASFLNDFDE